MKKILGTMVAMAVLAIFISSAPAATLSESPANIAQGGTVTATWSAIAAPTNRDWIGLYAAGAADTSFIDWIYDNSCNRAGNNSALGAGACPFLIPNALINGTYELRLYANNNYIRLATSGQFTVSPTRYVDNGDGTISDIQTGLMWEKKLAADDVVTGNCTNAAQANRSIRCVNNSYTWSVIDGQDPNGTLFTDFLAKMAPLGTSADGATVVKNCFAGHCDWRIPDIAELRTILLSQFPCTTSPCIDPIFGPTSPFYWSSTTFQSDPDNAWFVFFDGGAVHRTSKDDVILFARAVRGGS